MIEFRPYGKTPRLFRDIVISEKIDGSNAAVIVRDLGTGPLPVGTIATDDFETRIFTQGSWYGVGAQSRNRLVKPGKSTDNSGFAAWVHDNAAALAVTLGVGHHYGEWWGQGINRGYGLDYKMFSLFNAHRYGQAVKEHNLDFAGQLDTVPVMYQGPYSEEAVRNAIIALRNGGSWAAPGFMRPEGVITYHSASSQVYKTLLDEDHLPKSLRAAA